MLRSRDKRRHTHMHEISRRQTRTWWWSMVVGGWTCFFLHTEEETFEEEEVNWTLDMIDAME